MSQKDTSDSDSAEVVLAKNLAAAYIAYATGMKSIDYVRKKYVEADDEPIGERWIELARAMMERPPFESIAPKRPGKPN